MYCKNCGKVIEDGIKFCPECGAAQDTAAPSENEMQKTGKEGHGHAIASLVLGIISVVLLFTVYGGIVSFILAIVGWAQAGSAKKLGNTEGIRTAGFVLSLVAFIIGIIEVIWVIYLLAFAGAAVGAGLGILSDMY